MLYEVITGRQGPVAGPTAATGLRAAADPRQPALDEAFRGIHPHARRARFRRGRPDAHRRDRQPADLRRITSYNVCYTKLLRGKGLF